MRNALNKKESQNGGEKVAKYHLYTEPLHISYKENENQGKRNGEDVR